MNKLRLLQLWNQLKRLLRGLIIKIGMGKTINWIKTFKEFMGIMEAVADVQDDMEQSGEIPADPITSKQEYQPSKEAIAKLEEKKRRRLFGRKL